MTKWILEKRLGFFRNDKLSKQLRYAAIVQSKVIQFAAPMMPAEKVAVSRGNKKVEIKVFEVGRGLRLPDPFSPSTSFDLGDPIQKRLIEQLQRVLDGCSTSALKSSALEVSTPVAAIKRLILKAKWSGLEAILGVSLGYLSSYCRPYEQNYYVGIGGARLIRKIKKLRSFLTWQKYLKAGDILFNEEIGLTNNNIRWVRYSDTSYFLDDGVVFGDTGLFFKEVLTPELRVYESNIAWYGQLSFVGQNVLHIPEIKRRTT